jgi:hypothetical protein
MTIWERFLPKFRGLSIAFLIQLAIFSLKPLSPKFIIQGWIFPLERKTSLTSANWTRYCCPSSGRLHCGNTALQQRIVPSAADIVRSRTKHDIRRDVDIETAPAKDVAYRVCSMDYIVPHTDNFTRVARTSICVFPGQFLADFETAADPLALGPAADGPRDAAAFGVLHRAFICC